MEARAAGGARPFGELTPGESLVPGRRRPRARSPPRTPTGARLWLARLDLGEPVEQYLQLHGRPIRYGYVTEDWPLEAYQNVYATEAGSAEMASAGRPFTAELITRLVASGVDVAPVTLHSGVSSPGARRAAVPRAVPRARRRRHASSTRARAGADG